MNAFSFDSVCFGNSIRDYAISALLLILFIAVIKLFRKIMLSRIKNLTRLTHNNFDDFLIDALPKDLQPIFYYGALYLSIYKLELHSFVRKGLNIGGILFLTYYGIKFIVSLFEFLINEESQKYQKDGGRQAKIPKGSLALIKIIIWTFGIFFLLDNLGFKISTVIAGLGIGGIAVALAAQNLLGDIFSYFIIMFDKPFEIGDFIVADDFRGEIEYVGVKTTRVRSLSGELLIFPNKDLTGTRIVRNYQKMLTRRVLFKLGVLYDTTAENLKEIPGVMKQIILGAGDTTFDRCHFSSYGDFSLVIETVYFVKGNDYNTFMDTQQRINLAIKEEFEKRGISFAYPTQTVYLAGQSIK